MLATVEVLDALVVLLAEVRSKVALICLVIAVVGPRVHVQTLVEVDFREKRVFRDQLIQDVKVERQLVN